MDNCKTCTANLFVPESKKLGICVTCRTDGFSSGATSQQEKEQESTLRRQAEEHYSPMI